MYEKQISSKYPSAFLFLIDQSESMSKKDQFGKTLAETLSDVINRFLQDLVLICTGSEGLIKDRLDVGIIGYGKDKNSGEECYNGLKSNISEKIMNKISDIYNNPLTIENRMQKQYDGAGGTIDIPISFPVWFEPVANGQTPMCKAFEIASEELANWCDRNPESFPPILINITDGLPTDGDPEEIANLIKNIHTEDGNVLVFNLHITPDRTQEFLFLDSEIELEKIEEIKNRNNAKKFFRMSSLFTEEMVSAAIEDGFSVNPNSRGYCYNAKIESVVRFLNVGSTQAVLKNPRPL